MAIFKRISKAQGGEDIFRNETENKVVDRAEIPEAVLEELLLADPGEEIDSETIEDDSAQIDPKTNQRVETDAEKAIREKNEAEAEEKAEKTRKEKTAAARKKAQEAADDDDEDEEDEPGDSNPHRKFVPQSEKGFGFPRKNGLTGDIFDVSIPHTTVRLVEGLMVPLSEKNKNRTDAEIYNRLVELDLI